MSELTAGLSVGSYELVEVIGRTGMSEVWRAIDRRGNMVALKTISPQAGEDPQLRARFLREGGEHQLLKHASIVPILDFFEQDGDFYLAMQYISGGSLEDRMERNGWQPLPIPEALKIARQILPALDYAHQRLIIHRDVKPSNILLEGDRAYLSDFGIALAVGRPRLTTFAQILGTRSYMSPEQIQTPLAITHLTDVYSFGCMLYEMLTGRQPHSQVDDSEEDQYAMLAKRVHEPPVAPRQWNPEIPTRLERIVLTALSPNPKDRFAGCGSFARALEGVELERMGNKAAVAPFSVPHVVVPEIGVHSLVDSSVPPQTREIHKSLRPVSLTGNVLAAVFAGYFWILFSGQPRDTYDFMLTLGMVVANILFLRMLYRAWAALPSSRARTTPGKAVGYLFIPFYHLYWGWKVIPGFASDYNQVMRQIAPLEKPQVERFYQSFYILHFCVPWVVALFQVRELLGWALALDFMILIPIMIGVLANAVNRMVGARRQATAVGGEQGTPR